MIGGYATKNYLKIMTQKKQIYHCDICGNTVEVLDTGQGTLVCCGQSMRLLEENNVDASREKHVPVIEKTQNGIKVQIGSSPHPMEETHYIEWVELNINGNSWKTFLKPYDLPETEFITDTNVRNGKVRIYCNLHGLWSNDFYFE